MYIGAGVIPANVCYPGTYVCHYKCNIIHQIDMEIVTKSEKQTGCFNLRWQQLLRISSTSGAMGGVSALFPPEISTSCAGR